ncbi:MAG: hypothetical protein PF517_09740 [Salinivirgaceae bacterium]|jgi:hypothetical protein|nr:hypothetical protein [Salinivirgaceae bacterium]
MLKFLLIFFIVIYLIGYLGRFLFTRWIKKVSNQQMGGKDFNPKPEGEVTVDSNAKKSKKDRFEDGDYVDYEEIND